MYHIPEEFEPCARNEHQWFEGTDPEWTPPFNMAGEVHICDRCTAVRRRCINALGIVDKNLTRYIYPDGYSMRGDERPSKRQLREAWYKKQKAQGKVRRGVNPKKTVKKPKGTKRKHLQAV